MSHQVEYILGRRVMSRKAWRLYLGRRTSRFLESGSLFRWSGDELFDEGLEEDPQNIERFLIKWVGKSYLHVSWELKEDILEPSMVVQAPIGKYGPRKLLDDFMFCSTRPYVYHHDVDFFRKREMEEYFSPERMMITSIIGVKEGKEEHEECIPIQDLHSKNCKVLVVWNGENHPLPNPENYELVKDLQSHGVDYELALRRCLRMAKQTFAAGHPQQPLVLDPNTSERLQALPHDKFLEHFFVKCGLTLTQPYPHQVEAIKVVVSAWIRRELCCFLADAPHSGQTTTICAALQTISVLNKPRPPQFLILTSDEDGSALAAKLREWTTWERQVLHITKENAGSVNVALAYGAVVVSLGALLKHNSLRAAINCKQWNLGVVFLDELSSNNITFLKLLKHFVKEKNCPSWLLVARRVFSLSKFAAELSPSVMMTIRGLQRGVIKQQGDAEEQPEREQEQEHEHDQEHEHEQEHEQEQEQEQEQLQSFKKLCSVLNVAKVETINYYKSLHRLTCRGCSPTLGLVLCDAPSSAPAGFEGMVAREGSVLPALVSSRSLNLVAASYGWPVVDGTIELSSQVGIECIAVALEPTDAQRQFMAHFLATEIWPVYVNRNEANAAMLGWHCEWWRRAFVRCAVDPLLNNAPSTVQAGGIGSLGKATEVTLHSSSKLRYLAELLPELLRKNGGTKVALFTNLRASLTILQELCRSLGIPTCCVEFAQDDGSNINECNAFIAAQGKAVLLVACHNGKCTQLAGLRYVWSVLTEAVLVDGFMGKEDFLTGILLAAIVAPRGETAAAPRERVVTVRRLVLRHSIDEAYWQSISPTFPPLPQSGPQTIAIPLFAPTPENLSLISPLLNGSNVSLPMFGLINPNTSIPNHGRKGPFPPALVLLLRQTLACIMTAPPPHQSSSASNTPSSGGYQSTPVPVPPTPISHTLNDLFEEVFEET